MIIRYLEFSMLSTLIYQWVSGLGGFGGIGHCLVHQHNPIGLNHLNFSIKAPICVKADCNLIRT